eukprot:1159931-Pelagomonas_calceolata.AAC.2
MALLLLIGRCTECGLMALTGRCSECALLAAHGCAECGLMALTGRCAECALMAAHGCAECGLMALTGWCAECALMAAHGCVERGLDALAAAHRQVCRVCPYGSCRSRARADVVLILRSQLRSQAGKHAAPIRLAWGTLCICTAMVLISQPAVYGAGDYGCCLWMGGALWVDRHDVDLIEGCAAVLACPDCCMSVLFAGKEGERL